MFSRRGGSTRPYAIKKVFTPKNPFALFFKYCKTWCVENDIYPDYDLSKQVAISNKCSIDDKVLNSNTVFGERPKTTAQRNISEPKVMSSVERLQAQKAKAADEAQPIGVGVKSEIEELKSEITKLQDKINNIHTLGIPSFLLDVTVSRYRQDLEIKTKRLLELC